MNREIYENPLSLRYASREMNHIWSPQFKFSTWRQLWLALARAESELGLPISDAQLQELELHIDDINFEVAEAKERELRHDVMSHVHALGEQCPLAKPIIHLGATSCYVTDNTELLQMRRALQIVRGRLGIVMRHLRDFAMQYRELPTLGYTHFQPAQLTTVGKRATLWLYDFVQDLEEIEHLLREMPFRGVKGTTGTQASFLELFEGDHEKVKRLDMRVAELMGFGKRVPVSGQTYSRKLDFRVLSVLSGIAQSAAKMASDVRLLAHLKEIEEPFGKKQIGSSAMAYKRNPMKSERICSLSRFVMSLPVNAAETHANQWFERTLDDSANRRLSLPQGFLGVDVILSTAAGVVDGLQVWPRVIARNLERELPFMATENIMMAAVKAGGDRQELHEAVREHAMAAGRRIKEQGENNDLLQRIAADPLFAAVKDKLDTIMEPASFTGRAAVQTAEFVESIVDPLLAHLQDIDSTAAEAVNV